MPKPGLEISVPVRLDRIDLPAEADIVDGAGRDFLQAQPDAEAQVVLVVDDVWQELDDQHLIEEAVARGLIRDSEIATLKRRSDGEEGLRLEDDPTVSMTDLHEAAGFWRRRDRAEALILLARGLGEPFADLPDHLQPKG